MVCAKALDLALPSLHSRHVPKTKFITSFAFLKNLSGVSLSVVSLHLGDKKLKTSTEPSSFQMVLSAEGDEKGGHGLQQGSSISKIKRRRAKSTASLVQPTERRFTRSCLKTDGYRPAPILAMQPKIKKKIGSKEFIIDTGAGGKAAGT
jgi:uncharacterized Fe-S center protein